MEGVKLGKSNINDRKYYESKIQKWLPQILFLFLEFEPVPEPSYGLTILKTDYKQRKKENDFFIKWQKIQDNLNASMKYDSLTKLVLTLKGQDLW